MACTKLTVKGVVFASQRSNLTEERRIGRQKVVSRQAKAIGVRATQNAVNGESAVESGAWRGQILTRHPSLGSYV